MPLSTPGSQRVERLAGGWGVRLIRPGTRREIAEAVRFQKVDASSLSDRSVRWLGNVGNGRGGGDVAERVQHPGALFEAVGARHGCQPLRPHGWRLEAVGELSTDHSPPVPAVQFPHQQRLQGAVDDEPRVTFVVGPA